MKTSVPLYHQLKATMLSDIQNEKWRVGQKIPSEASLSKEMGVSRITVRQAIGELVSLGYLVRHQGKGTFVAKRTRSFAASRLHGFAEELRARGYEVQIDVKSLERIIPPKEVIQSLELAANQEVIWIYRLAIVGRKTVFRENSYLVIPPHATLEELTRQSGLYNHVYGFFEHYGVRIAYGQQNVSATKPNEDDVQEFKMLRDEPILMIRRVTSDDTGTPVEFSEVRYPSGRYQFEVSLSRDN